MNRLYNKFYKFLLMIFQKISKNLKFGKITEIYRDFESFC